MNQWRTRNHGFTKLVLTIDFKNAFNHVSRQRFLEEVDEHMPGMSRWAQWCYCVSARLAYGSHLIQSRCGVQQGDPLGPLLFSLAIHPIALRLAGLGRGGNPGRRLDLCFFYLDDGVLAGDPLAVAEALKTLIEECPALGLTLELSKSELVVMNDEVSQDLHRLFPRDLLIDQETGECRVRRRNFELLGAPFGSSEFCGQDANERINKALPLLRKLENMPDPQVGTRLLRRCAGFCKLLFSIRVVPSVAHQTELTRFVYNVRATFQALTGLTTVESQWEQACRCFALAGVGLRSCARHAHPAYIASRTQTHDLCCKLDSEFRWEGADQSSWLGQGLAALNFELPEHARLNADRPDPVRQQTLSKGLERVDHERFFRQLSLSDQAQINSEMLPGASDFLEAVPSSETGLAMSPEEFVSELRTRLLMNHLPGDDWCPLCNCIMGGMLRSARVVGTAPADTIPSATVTARLSTLLAFTLSSSGQACCPQLLTSLMLTGGDPLMSTCLHGRMARQQPLTSPSHPLIAGIFWLVPPLSPALLPRLTSRSSAIT